MPECTRRRRQHQAPRDSRSARAFAARLLAAILALGIAVGAHAAAPLPDAPYGALVADVWDRDLGGGIRLDEARVQRHEVGLTLHHPDGRYAGRLLLRHPTAPGRRTASFAVGVQVPFSQVRTPEQAQARDAITTVFRAIDDRDPGGLDATLNPWERTRWLRTRVVAPLLGIPLGLVVAVALGAAILRQRLIGPVEIRGNHLVPATIQVILYAYWGLYVATVRDRYVDIAAQLLFAYAIDALISLLRGRPWQLRLAPVPVVLSTNLFVWFNDPALQLTAIAIALCSKEWITRKDGHVFNPSAFGIAVLAAATLVLPGWFRWGSPTPDVELNLPPNMAELMGALALIAQLRFPIVAVPMFATIGLSVIGMMRLGPPDPFWPATFLILLLFATDPKTLPKTIPGKALFGLLFGLAIGLISHALRLNHQPDVYAKVLPIPVLNALAPQLDAIGGWLYAAWGRLVRWRPPIPWWALALAAVFAVVRIDRPLWLGLALAAAIWGLHKMPAWQESLRGWFSDPLHPRLNRVHVAVWVVIAVLGISRGKAKSFQAYNHWALETPGVVSTDDAFPVCDDNPVWCAPFSVIGEVGLWTR